MATKDESCLIVQGSNGEIEVTVEFPCGGSVHLRGLFESEAKALAWVRLRGRPLRIADASRTL